MQEFNVYGEFFLSEDIFQEDDQEDNIIIEEHNDIYNDPIYRSSDSDILDEDQDGYENEIDLYHAQIHQFQNHYVSEDSAYVKDGSTHNDNDSDSISWDGEDSVCTFRDHGFYGWLSSDNDNREAEGAVGYAIDYDLINQQDEAWEAFILAT